MVVCAEVFMFPETYSLLDRVYALRHLAQFYVLCVSYASRPAESDEPNDTVCAT
jgi:hypothetical protein